MAVTYDIPEEHELDSFGNIIVKQEVKEVVLEAKLEEKIKALKEVKIKKSKSK